MRDGVSQLGGFRVQGGEGEGGEGVGEEGGRDGLGGCGHCEDWTGSFSFRGGEGRGFRGLGLGSGVDEGEDEGQKSWDVGGGGKGGKGHYLC